MLLPTFILAATLTFPIPQLGNCQSVKECKTYCDIPWHQTVCEDHAQELEEKEKVLAAIDLDFPISELGNCQSKEDCKAYCELPINYQACSQFAEEHGLPTAKRPKPPGHEKLDRLTFPIPELGNCASREECKEYCDNPANRENCQSFAEEQGLMEPKEPPESQEPPAEAEAELKFPIAELGNCGSIDECDAYCQTHKDDAACQEYAEMTNMEEFNEEGFGEPEEPDHATPEITFPIAELGNCGSMEECAVYCQQPDHQEKCSAFAQERGMAPPKKMEGPGGCSSPEECKTYCSNPDHKKECQEFAQKMCAENPDLEHCKQGPPGAGPGGCTSPEECKEYCMNHPGDSECQKAKERFCIENPEKCKKKEGEMKGKEPGSNMDKMDITGPGGCTTPEECRKYCENNPDDTECKEMKPKPDDMEKKEKVGPGGCSSPEECIKYCKNNPSDPACSDEMMEKVEDYEKGLEEERKRKEEEMKRMEERELEDLEKEVSEQED